MRIAFAINNLGAGGAERVVSTLSNELCKRNSIEVFIICIDFPIEYDELEIFYSISSEVKLVLINPDLFEDTCKKIIKLNLDVVISFLYPMYYFMSRVTREVNVAHIISERNDPFCYKMSNKGFARREQAFSSASGLVFQTEHAYNYYQGFCSCHFEIIPNPIFFPLQIMNCNKPYKKTDIIAVGRYAKQKNYPKMIDGFEDFVIKNKEYHLHIYGKNSGEKHFIDDYIERKGLKSQIHLHSATNNIFQIMQRSACFLMTSDYEGTPNAFIEAAALGLECIVPDIPGVRDFVHKYKCGILLTDSSVSSISNALKQVLVKDVQLKSCHSVNQTILQDRHVSIVANIWIDFITKVLSD